MSFSPRTTDPLPSSDPLTDAQKNASWGAILAIVVILAMIVVGAFYAWGKRIAEEHSVQAAAAAFAAMSSTTVITK